MSIAPERFDLPQGQKVAITVLAGVMFAIGLVGAFFAWHGVDGAEDPRASTIGFAAIASLFGCLGAIIALAARQAWRAAITLRDGGVEIERGDQLPSFIGWGQIGGLKMLSAGGGTAVLGLGGDTLFNVDSRLIGAGRLLHAILVNAILPKHSPALPYRAEQSIPRLVPVAIFGGLAVGAVLFLVRAPAAARQAVFVSLAVVGAIVAAVGALAARFGSAGAVTVEADGITFGRTGTRRPWNTVQGAALAFVRGPKGERFPRVALYGTDGRWEPISLPGTDLVELLAAINAAAP
ncbi:MAG: hypothetical protein JF590_00120, partial [Gemmatimonadetes bacterium]|nr:hypothetical protein [Gemmatimonadota bacterium]